MGSTERMIGEGRWSEWRGNVREESGSFYLFLCVSVCSLRLVLLPPVCDGLMEGWFGAGVLGELKIFSEDKSLR